MFLNILNHEYFKGFYMPKNTFFEGKKFFPYKIFGTFCTCTKVGCAKNTTSQLKMFVELRHGYDPTKHSISYIYHILNTLASFEYTLLEKR